MSCWTYAWTEIASFLSGLTGDNPFLTMTECSNILLFLRTNLLLSINYYYVVVELWDQHLASQPSTPVDFMECVTGHHPHQLVIV